MSCYLIGCRYATQASQLNPEVTNGRADWTPLDREELLAWFGILILLGLKEFPHIRCYWDRRPFYNCPLISETMPRKRFEAITRCLHLLNNAELINDRSNPAYDKLAKVRWLCESFAHMSQTLYNNEHVLIVDEIIIPYKGRFCNIRQYMKSKPVKFGVKVWALANAESRYVILNLLSKSLILENLILHNSMGSSLISNCHCDTCLVGMSPIL